jgi:hypothetical protein
MKTEPTRYISIATAFVTAVLALVVAFGLSMSPDQRNAIIGVITPTVTLIVVAGELSRSRVTPVAKAEQAIEEAYQAEPGKDPKPALSGVHLQAKRPLAHHGV